MKVLPINNNYQNNTNFKGTVSKSVVKYLNEVRFDALNKPKSFFGDLSEKITTETYTETKNMIEGIMSKLNDFMAKTHPKTKISIFDFAPNRSIRFENSDLNTFVQGAHFWLIGSEEEYGTVNDKGTIFLKDPKLKSFERASSHTFEELARFDEYTTELTEKINPKAIDGAIFDSKAIEVVKKAEETAPKNRFENRLAFNHLDRLASKFHREPIYTEQFKIIQSLAIKLQEESAKSPIEQSKEELKSLKIK